MNFQQLRKQAVDLKPRGLRWFKVRLTMRKALKKEMDIEKNFETNIIFAEFQPCNFMKGRVGW